jgi:spore coat protein U-like protein
MKSLSRLSKLIRVILIVCIFASCGIFEAWAATATTTLVVSATIVDTCTVTATPLTFGTYSASSASPNDATATVTVLYTVGTGFTVAFDAGTATGATLAQRRLQNAVLSSDRLNYNIYRNTARSEIWGDGAKSTYTVIGTGTGVLTAVTLTAYGRIPTGQDVGLGAYADSITVTLTY